MPTSTTFHVIYLGQLNIIDPIEGTATRVNNNAEDANLLANTTYDNFTRDSVQVLSPISYNSRDGDGNTSTYNQDNFRGNDTFSITDADGGVTSHIFDAAIAYNAVITYADGSTATTTLVIMQDADGNTWVAPPPTNNTTAALLGADPIQSIRLTSLVQSNTAGLFATREDINMVTVPCFAAGTTILTPVGDVPVEKLVVGDLVMTRDKGPQPIRWIGNRVLGQDELQAEPRLRPIRISRGALGIGLPSQDLLVSPQHRVLVQSRIAQRIFGTDEVLVPAKTLVVMEGVDIDEAPEGVTYYHLMFEHHEVIVSNGAASESFYPGPQALRSVDKAALDELLAIFPQLGDDILPEAARLIPSGRKARKLAMRHAQNRRPLQIN